VQKIQKKLTSATTPFETRSAKALPQFHLSQLSSSFPATPYPLIFVFYHFIIDTFNKSKKIDIPQSAIIFLPVISATCFQANSPGLILYSLPLAFQIRIRNICIFLFIYKVQKYLATASVNQIN
jgi:hypothetical protein